MAAVVTCTVVGQMIATDGRLLAGGDVKFTPSPIVRGDQTYTIIPEPVTAPTDSEGRFSITLTPDRYRVIYVEDGKERPPEFEIVVPALPLAEVETLRVGAGALVTVLDGGNADPAFEVALFAGGA